MVRITDQLSFDKSLSTLLTADLLLLYIAPGYNSQAEMPGKIFEYLRSYKPILAIVPPDGAAAEILKQSGTGLLCDSSDIESVKSRLAQIYIDWEKGALAVTPDQDYINKFNRRALTGELASLFEEVLVQATKSQES
jgi:hypothetical protein